MRYDNLSSLICHWYVQADRIIEAIGSYNDGNYKRPRYTHV